VAAHKKAYLALSYEQYIERNGGEFCGICKQPPKPGGRRLHRDHDHRTGSPRGLLCFRDNAAIRTYMTLPWAIKLVFYLTKYATPQELGSPTTEENRGADTV
jgi:hypothetical protein